MDKALLTQVELGKLLGMNRDRAVEFCEAHGVYAINTSTTPKPRWRWVKQHVIDLLGSLSARETRPAHGVAASMPSLVDMSTGDIFKLVGAA